MVLPGVAETNEGNAARPGKVRLHFWSLDRAKPRRNSLIKVRMPRGLGVPQLISHRAAESKTG